MALDPTRQATPPHSSGAAAIDVSVAWVQQRLNLFRRTTGQAPIAVDGIAGPETAAATHDFLVRLGVPPNGIFAGELYDVANSGTPGRVRMTIPVESALNGRAPGATGSPFNINVPSSPSAAGGGGGGMVLVLGLAAGAAWYWFNRRR